MRTRAPLYLGLLACGTLVACRSANRPFAKLQSAVVNSAYDVSPSSTEVRIVRADSTVTPALSLRLRSGDSVATSSGASVVLEFSAGYVVTLDTGTVLYIVEDTASVPGGADGFRGAADAGRFSGFRNANRAVGPLSLPSFDAGAPSSRPMPEATGRGTRLGDASMPRVGLIFLSKGRAFIKRVGNALNALQTLDMNTPQSVLHDAGTEYMVSVIAEQTFVRVITGEVVAESRDGQWSSVRYGPGSGGVLRTNAPPQRTATATGSELENELAWVRRVERLTTVIIPPLDSLTEQQARDSLGRVGLRVLFTTRRETPDFAVGRVVDVIPAPGERVAPNTFVSLVLARAPRGEMCRVPDITGKSDSVAKALLSAERLRGQRTNNQSTELDVVTSQRERAGTRLRCGSTVQYFWGSLG